MREREDALYNIGERIMYGSMGVCSVEDICVPDLAGAVRQCYLLRPLHVPNSKVYAPVDGNAVQTRPLLTRQQALELVDGLGGVEAFPADRDRQEFHTTCRNAIKSADSFMLAKLLKTLYMKRRQLAGHNKLVPSLEREYFDTAERMLYGELSAVLQMSLEEVEGFIEDRLEKVSGGEKAAVS